MQEFKYRPVAAIVSGATIILVDTLVAVLDYRVNGVASFLGSLPLYLLVLWIVIVFLLKPRVVISGESILITNPFRQINLELTQLLELETRRGLVLITSEGRIPVAVGVAPSRYAIARANKADFKWARSSGDGQPGDLISPGDILESDSGAVAFVIRQQLKALRENPKEISSSSSVSFKIDYLSIVSGAFLVVATAFQALS
jgi:hypothetical protein